eukprot:TRINITY_DN30994_c0_g1_i1.p1 TRINITY_DN30994_c0_g1~~TRINITY_DN30994_c0_g1_i1.p1  ORF type:complete len:250 (+),score=26.26 TRINITY_DN30994_c0_g1_i1:132-881(+)
MAEHPDFYGGPVRKFRTLYALAAPDYNMHDILGLDPKELAEVQVPKLAFPGRAEAKVPNVGRRPQLSKSWSHTMPGNPNEKHLETQPLVSRWWLHEVRHDKSAGEGLYEVLTGMIALYNTPDRKSERRGVIRSGTRFRATPYFIKGSTWLHLKKETNAPLLSTSIGGSRDLLHYFHETSGVQPMCRGEHPLYVLNGHEVLHDTNDLWVEDNKQYIVRRRDICREKGDSSYSVCTLEAMRKRRANSVPLR